MKMRFFFVCLILLMSSLQGCLSDDDSSSSSSTNCDDDALDSELYGLWLWHTYHDHTIRELTFQSNGEREGWRADAENIEYTCWYIDGDELIEHSHYPQQADYYRHINYHIEGDLLFYSYVYYDVIDLNGQDLGTGYNDWPTECMLYHKLGAFSDNTTLNTTINATQFPDFCTWIFADPTGASHVDAWASTHYLAQDHSDSVTTGSNDKLMTIEIDEFYGELDWYVSEGYFGFTLNITVNNQYYTCYTNWGDADCIISFSGIDNYYAVWEEFEIATVAENGVDICSVQCDIEINELHLREEDWLPGTTDVTVQ